MLSVSDRSHQSVSFELHADAEPGLLPRVLVPFARRDLVPDQMKSRRTGDTMVVSLGMDAMPSEMVHLVEGNLRQIVGLRRLTVVLRRSGSVLPGSVLPGSVLPGLAAAA